MNQIGEVLLTEKEGEIIIQSDDRLMAIQAETLYVLNEEEKIVAVQYGLDLSIIVE